MTDRGAFFPQFTERDAARPIVVLSSGIGQDSFALTILVAQSASFRERFIGDADVIVVTSDTGDEHFDTNAFLEATYRPFCAEWGLPFFFLRRDLGYHTGAWVDGLRGQYRAHDSIGMMTTRSCTDSLKVAPIYKFLDEYIGRRYGLEFGRKKALRGYVDLFGKLRVMVGFAAGEETRVAATVSSVEQMRLDLALPRRAKAGPPAWMIECVERVYPLIDLGMDRAACQAFADQATGVIPPPSNCRACHFKSPEELAWTALTDPAGFAEWVQLEANKIAKHAHRPTNNGVKGAKLLPQIVAETRAKYAHLTDAAYAAFLSEYRMSHGHCVRTSY